MYNHVQAIAREKEHTGEKEVRNEAIREALAVGFGYFHSICGLERLWKERRWACQHERLCIRC